MCVVSAVLAALVILAAVLVQIVLFYVDSSLLNLWKTTVIDDPPALINTTEDDSLAAVLQIFNDTLTNDTLTSNSSLLVTPNIIATAEEAQKDGKGIGLYNTIYLAMVGVIGVLAAITAGLLIHLCLFHIYISYLGLTTYEYIRNHRQSLVATNQSTVSRNGPSTKTYTSKTLAKEFYVCSSINPLSEQLKTRPKTLHCCDEDKELTENGGAASEYSHKAFYVCSMYEEKSTTTSSATTAGTQQFSTKTSNDARTFHCCSEFLHASREVEAESIVEYTEQCSFCSFKIKSPTKTNQVAIQEKRCCMKSISKHHRWKRKWNCCLNVPDTPSPDVVSDPLRTISGGIQYPTVNTVHSQNDRVSILPYVQIQIPIENGANLAENPSPIQYNISNGTHELIEDSPGDNNTLTNASSSNHVTAIPNSPEAASKRTRSRLVRPWPVVRLRHMFRMIGRYRRPRCRHGINSVAIKQNQIRPFPSTNSNESLAVPPQEISMLAIFNNESPPLMPALPPPTRRKIKTTPELQDLADNLQFIQQPANSYRRNKRKHVLRNRSPTLSPIHESGLSIPNSPQTCRHNCSGSISSLGNSSICGTSLNANRPL